MTDQHRDTIFDTLTRTLSVIRRSASTIAALHNATLGPEEAAMRWQDAVLCNEHGEDETAGSMERRLLADARPGGRLRGRIKDDYKRTNDLLLSTISL